MFRVITLLLTLTLMLPAAWAEATGDAAPRDRAFEIKGMDTAIPKIVKIYGAGGVEGMKSYQSGCLISPDGLILTVFSTVLDADSVTAILGDGRRFEAKLLGADPRNDVALLKIEGKELPYFKIDDVVPASGGATVFALSNLFGVATGDEPVSVQHGVISVVTRLDTRKGTYETPYHGPIYVLDVKTNNPGAAGGALVDTKGNLLAMLGKELRNAQEGTWLNYALPIGELRPSIESIRTGKLIVRDEDQTRRKSTHPVSLEALGLRLVPDVMLRTPPFVEQVLPNSAAARADLRSDDLIVLLGEQLIPSCRSLVSELRYLDEDEPIRLTVMRGRDLIEVTLRAEEELK